MPENQKARKPGINGFWVVKVERTQTRNKLVWVVKVAVRVSKIGPENALKPCLGGQSNGSGLQIGPENALKPGIKWLGWSE